MRYLLPALFEIALVTYCIVDIIQHRDEKPHGFAKVFWVIVVLLFVYVGSAVWIILKIRDFGATSRPQPRSPRAPDDDPEYIRWLREQERRRREEKRDT